MKIGNNISVIPQDSLGAKGFFYVGGTEYHDIDKHFLNGQMFIEVYVPKKVKQKYPIILFHGAGQTNTNWLQTPDGRMGWADYFINQGFIVYLAEQPSRGRSAYHPITDGKQIYAPLEKLKSRFTSNQGNWERAKLHTQWPDDRSPNDTSIFKQFAASQVEYLPSNKHSQELVQAASKELLDKTGPAILLTHSQSGPFGWNMADAFPEQIKGIIALEPSGPPFSNGVTNALYQNYGISDLPLHFDPPIIDATQLDTEILKSRQKIETDGWVLKEPAPKLINLQKIPIALIVSESSYHSNYDHLTSYVLNQCGVKHDFIRLEELDINGNGHMMMLEKNNLEIASMICNWISQNIK